MQTTSHLAALISMLLPRLPFFLVCIAGVAVALVRMNSNRRPALFVLLGSLALLTGFLMSVGSNLLVLQRNQSGASTAELGAMLAVLGFVQGVLSAGGFALLIWAAFTDRGSAAPSMRRD